MSDKIEVSVLNSYNGYTLSIDDVRVSGPKPLGSGRVVHTFYVDVNELDSILTEHRKDTAEGKACDKCGGDGMADTHSCTDEDGNPYFYERVSVWVEEKEDSPIHEYCEACGIELSTLKCECQVEKGGNDD